MQSSMQMVILIAAVIYLSTVNFVDGKTQSTASTVSVANLENSPEANNVVVHFMDFKQDEVSTI